MDIGFIGIGRMGAAMVATLVKAGHLVSVWNRTLAATRALEGVTVLPSIASAFERDAVVTMLSDDTAVRSVVIDSGALASARKDCVHVMMSTISVALIEELEELHHREGIAYAAAPVFRVPAVAANYHFIVPVARHAYDAGDV